MAETAGGARRVSPIAEKRRPKGPRPKHVPQRMCVACRGHDAKRGLIRIVRTPEGTTELDPSGRRNGRGAYLCHNPACWERALRSGFLSRALKTEIDDGAATALRHHAATLARPTGDGAAADMGGNEPNGEYVPESRR